MSDPTTWYWIAAAVTAGSYVYEARETAEMEDERQRALKLDQKNAELQAKSEEISRLDELFYANSQIIAGASGIDAYASPSLTAIRQFNFRVAQRDLENLSMNLLNSRAQTASMIKLSKQTSRVAKVTGLLNAASTLTSAGATTKQLKTPKTPPKTATTTKRTSSNL